MIGDYSLKGRWQRAKLSWKIYNPNFHTASRIKIFWRCFWDTPRKVFKIDVRAFKKPKKDELLHIKFPEETTTSDMERFMKKFKELQKKNTERVIVTSANIEFVKVKNETKK